MKRATFEQMVHAHSTNDPAMSPRTAPGEKDPARASRPTAPARRSRSTDPPPGPIHGTLERRACERLLSRNHVGRIAFAFRRLVDIVPIHYTYVNGWIYGRTSPGHKISTIAHSQWVAFEVDEVRGPHSWESVVAHGSFYIVQPGGDEIERKAWRRARAAIRRLFPQAWTPDDPAASRTIVFRIHVAELTGRFASPPTGTMAPR